jgi:hypothetical protein
MQWRAAHAVGDHAALTIPDNHPFSGCATSCEGYRRKIATARANPVTVALVDDYDVVLLGVAHMLDQYRERVLIAEIDANEVVVDPVDLVLYECFAQPESDRAEITALVDGPHANGVAVYTWNFHPDLIRSAPAQGAHG